MGRLLIVGSGRSGTGYLCHLLRAAGLWCGHEQVFTPAVAAGQAPLDWGGYQGDSSWLAVPMLPQPEVRVICVLRHPLAVISSMTRIGLWRDDRDGNPYNEVYYGFRPEIRAERFLPDRALACWIHWYTAAAAHADLLLRLEDLHRPDTLGELLTAAGLSTARPERLPASVNALGDLARNRKLAEQLHPYQGGWDRHRPALARLGRTLASAFGYDPDQIPEVSCATAT